VPSAGALALPKAREMSRLQTVSLPLMPCTTFTVDATRWDRVTAAFSHGYTSWTSLLCIFSSCTAVFRRQCGQYREHIIRPFWVRTNTPSGTPHAPPAPQQSQRRSSSWSAFSLPNLHNHNYSHCLFAVFCTDTSPGPLGAAQVAERLRRCSTQCQLGPPQNRVRVPLLPFLLPLLALRCYSQPRLA
jgi:hypothetical protein